MFATPTCPLPLSDAWLTPHNSHGIRRIARKGSQREAILSFQTTLTDDAPMRRILDSAAFEKLLSGYEVADRKARTAQNIYKRVSWVALALVTIVTLLAALTLLPIFDRLPPEISRDISFLQSGANIAAFGIVFWLKYTGAIDNWLTARADAEAVRGRLFREIMRLPTPPGEDENTFWQNKLAFFNSTHTAYQRDYFRSAAKRHQTLAPALGGVRFVAMIVFGVAAIIGGFVFFGWWPTILTQAWSVLEVHTAPTRWQLGLNTITSGLLAYAGARVLVNQDERNAALYIRSGARLDELLSEQAQAKIQTAAAEGDEAKVMAHVDAVQRILDMDHEIWQMNRPSKNPLNAPAV